MSPIAIDYKTRYGKHCARYYGWLPASIVYKSHIGRSPKYFTLCGPQGIDVFMLEMEGVLQRDGRGRLPNVIIVEENRDCWEAIITSVRPPLEEAVINDKLEELIMYEDDAEVTQLLEMGDSARPSKAQREKLNRRERAQRLRDQFPFEIINFDPYGNLLYPAPENNKLYQAFCKIFELQAQTTIRRFLLFVTTPIYHIHPESQARLESDFESNVSSYPSIRTALESSLATIDYHEICAEKRIAIGFAKSMVISPAKGNGWNHKHHGIFVYETPSRNKMLSSVVEFSKADGPSDELASVTDIIRTIEQMPEYYSHEDSLGRQEVIAHLGTVTEYCENVRNEFTAQP